MLMHPQGIRRFTPSVDQLKNIPKEFHEDGKKESCGKGMNIHLKRKKTKTRKLKSKFEHCTFKFALQKLNSTKNTGNTNIP